MSQSVSPLAPPSTGPLPVIRGVSLGVAETGIRYKNRPDVMLAVLGSGTTVAGTFTASKTRSAPVDWCIEALAGGSARAVVVNSGNANAFTGRAGVKTVTEVARTAAKLLDCRPVEIFQASTGVIGEPLDPTPITNALPALVESAGADAWAEAARAIMTTDTFPKLSTVSARLGGVPVTMNGIAKGSGMIAPDMATLLAFVFTDARLPARVLQPLLSEGVKNSFNSITVDSDTSTSDTLLFFATGKGAKHPAVTSAADTRLTDFRRKLDELLLDLALQVVRDGEGASKSIQVDVTGAVSDASARKIALSIANSPLVKTAIAGGDANWGRVVMAIGKAGEPADRDRIRIWFGQQLVAETGARAANYNEGAASRAVASRDVRIAVELGMGEGRARIYTCDLTEGYIRINASYRS